MKIVSNTIKILLVLMLITGVASATDTYTLKITTELKQNTGWSPVMSKLMNTTDDQYVVGSLSIKYTDFDVNNKIAMLTISGGNNPTIYLGETHTKECVGGDNTAKCINDPDNATVGTVRITYISATLKTSGTTTTNSGTGDPITVYIQQNENKLTIAENSQGTFDVGAYNAKSGWTTTNGQKEANLYIQRNYGAASDPQITTTGQYEKQAVDTNTFKYILKTNTKYTFSIKTTSTGVWGGTNEKTVTYTVTVKGLQGGVGGGLPSAPAPYDVTKGVAKEFPLPDGTFTSSSGVSATKGTVNADGQVIWTLNFNTAGLQQLKYTTVDGSESAYAFRVVEPPAPASTAAGNQKQQTDSGSGTNYYVLGAILVLIGAAGFLILKRKKAPATRGNRDTDTPEDT